MASGPGIDFTVDLPPGWWELPVLSAQIRTDVAAIVDARMADAPAPPARREELIDALAGAAAEAKGAGAIFCAQVGVVDEGYEFSANIVVALRPIPGLAPGREIDELEEVARQLGTSPGIRQTPSRVERVTAPSLGAGVRHRAIRTVDGGVEAFVVGWYFPLPSSPLVVVINASSVNVDEADALLEMFDDIVGTIRITLVDA